jgi:CBS domain-containing protein
MPVNRGQHPMPVRNIMTPLSISIENYVTLGEAAILMRVRRAEAVAVYQAGALWAILTSTDVLARFPQDPSENWNHTLSRPLSEVMRPTLLYVQVNDKIEKAADIIFEHSLYILPVLDTDNRLSGVVNALDVLSEVLHRQRVQEAIEQYLE